MLGILGLPIDDKILQVLKSVTQEMAPQKEVHSKGGLKKPKSGALKKTTNCPRCQGAGFRHDSSSKHDKPPTEKCKSCTKCKGIYQSSKVCLEE